LFLLEEKNNFLFQMGVLQSTFLYLILLQACNKVASYRDEEWKSATATYIKDKDGSLITGIS